MKQWLMILIGLMGMSVVACTAAPAPNTPVPPTAVAADSNPYDGYEIITLLPPDAIPAIDQPTFLSGSAADGEYAPDELVIGVVFNGEARAYSVPHLSSHEIVNDTVGGVKIAVTW